MKHLKIVMHGVLIAVSILISCEQGDERDFRIRDHEYFPLLTGTFYIYDVEEIRYLLTVPETLHYELKHVVSDSFPNDAGGITYIIHRFSRPDQQSPWTPLESWSANIRGREAIVSEGNIPYVVLNFPLTSGEGWNGNAYNDRVTPFSQKNEDIYTVAATQMAFAFGESAYPDCVVVEQEDETDPILYRDFREEVYARHVGLVSRTVIQLAYCNNEGRGCVGQQLIDEGVRYHQTLKHYGKE